MATPFKLGTAPKVVDALVKAFLRIGIGGKSTYLLTVKGRRSGKLYSTPVILVEHEDQRWLVAPYGAVSWVLNARVAGQVTLTRGRRSQTVSITELGPAESAPVLKEYMTNVATVRPYFDATPESPVDAFATEASRHPVFRIGG